VTITGTPIALAQLERLKGVDGPVHALVDLDEGHGGELVRDGEVVAAGLGEGERVSAVRPPVGSSVLIADAITRTPNIAS
jgi:hypothetical protein